MSAASGLLGPNRIDAARTDAGRPSAFCNELRNEGRSGKTLRLAMAGCRTSRNGYAGGNEGGNLAGTAVTRDSKHRYDRSELCITGTTDDPLAPRH